MSTKTLRKRIALVAVAALGAGVLASAPSSASVAAIVNDTFDFSATTSIGICKAPAEASQSAGSPDYSGATYQASGVNTTAGNALQVGEVLNGGVIGFAIADDDITATNDTLTIAVTGPAYIASHTPESSGASRSFSAGLQTLTLTGTTTSGIEIGTAMTVAVNGVGAVQITISAAAANASATVLERYTFTASSSCATGKADPGNSIVKVIAYGTDETAITTNATETEAATLDSSGYVTNYASSADRIKNGGTAYIGIRVKDATSSANDVTTQGVFSATATNGVAIGWDTTGLALGSSSATAAGPSSPTAQTEKLLVTQGAANKDKPVTTTVSLYFNGVLYGTRTITFTGAAAKIEITDVTVGKAGYTSIGALTYEITDSAGNKLTSDGPGVDGSAAFSSSSGENNPLLASSGVVVDPTQAIVSAFSTINTESSTYVGTIDMTCGTGSGSAKVYVKYTPSNLATISSAQADFACGYGPANYKASLDKATYAPGEIATLTITATDKNGKAIWDYDEAGSVNYVGTTAKTISISMPQMTAVSAPTNTNYFYGSKKTYKFTVGSTEGTFAGVVDLPLYNSTAYSQSAQTISYKVAAAPTGAVTNADVLKAIVSLIASINKQIAALQKALLKK